MTGFRRRTAWLAAAALALAPALAACQPTHAGAAAVIGNSRVTTSTLAARVTRSLADPAAKQRFGSDRADFERRVLTLILGHQLIAVVAKRAAVTVSDAEVSARLAEFVRQAGSQADLDKQAAGAGIAKADLGGYVRDLVLTEKVGNKLTADTPVPAARLQQAYNQQFVKVHAAHILVKDKATADRLLAEVKANPAQFAPLAKKFSTDPGSKNTGGDLGTQSPTQFVPEFGQAVASAPVGSYVEVRSQFGFHVIHVIGRQATKTLAAATPELRAPLLQQARQQAVGALLERTSRSLGVRVNPRFGTWNAATATVTAPKDQLSRPEKQRPSPGPSG